MKISIQTGDIVDRLGIEKGYKAIKDAGFDAIDWNIDHAWKSKDLESGDYLGKCIFEKSLDDVIEHYSYELSVIKENGLEITQAHAPFSGALRKNPAVLDYAIGVYKRMIEFCAYAECKNLIIHGLPWDLSEKNLTYDDIHNMNMKMYSSLIPELQKCNVTVCLENLFTNHNSVNYQGHCSDSNQGINDIDYLNRLAGKECFGFCFDTGHANLLHQDQRVMLMQYGSRVKALHIHDNDGKDDLHQSPLTGRIDWNNFCEGLKLAGYKGDLSFETFRQTNMAMDFDEELLFPWMKLIYEIGNTIRNKIL